MKRPPAIPKNWLHFADGFPSIFAVRWIFLTRFFSHHKYSSRYVDCACFWWFRITWDTPYPHLSMKKHPNSGANFEGWRKRNHSGDRQRGYPLPAGSTSCHNRFRWKFQETSLRSVVFDEKKSAVGMLLNIFLFWFWWFWVMWGFFWSDKKNLTFRIPGKPHIGDCDYGSPRPPHTHTGMLTLR